MGQPRPRQTLERLEEKRAAETLLEAVAEVFAKGRHGEGDFLAAAYTDLLCNRNPAIIPRQLEKLRGTISRIHQELLEIASRLNHLREWETYRVLEYRDWAEFLDKELRLSEKVTGLLLIIVGKERESSFDTLVQMMLKGYVPESVSKAEPPRQIQREGARRKRARSHEKRSS
jgi:hypothetical protein